MIYRIYGNTFSIKEDLKAFKCKWDSTRNCWTTPDIEKKSETHKRLESIIDAIDGILVPTELSPECRKIQRILNGDS